MEDHASKGIRHNHWIGSRFHIVSVEHLARRFCHFTSIFLIVPSTEETGITGIPDPLANGGTAIGIGTQQAIAYGLSQANIPRKSAIGSRHQDFLPIPKIHRPPGLNMAGFLLDIIIGC